MYNVCYVRRAEGWERLLPRQYCGWGTTPYSRIYLLKSRYELKLTFDLIHTVPIFHSEDFHQELFIMSAITKVWANSKVGLCLDILANISLQGLNSIFIKKTLQFEKQINYIILPILPFIFKLNSKYNLEKCIYKTFLAIFTFYLVCTQSITVRNS